MYSTHKYHTQHKNRKAVSPSAQRARALNDVRPVALKALSAAEVLRLAVVHPRGALKDAAAAPTHAYVLVLHHTWMLCRVRATCRYDARWRWRGCGGGCGVDCDGDRDSFRNAFCGLLLHDAALLVSQLG